MEIKNQAVYHKIALHALKYPNSEIKGFLIGSSNQVQDIIPLSHTPLNSSLFHIAMNLIQNNGRTICGIYEVSEKH